MKITTSRVTTKTALNLIANQSTSMEIQTLTSTLLISKPKQPRTHINNPSTMNTEAYVANGKGETKDSHNCHYDICYMYILNEQLLII